MGMGRDAEVDFVANLAPMMSSVTHTWRTPAAVLNRVRAYAGGPIALDPCPSVNPEHWIAEHNLSTAVGHDGLTADWCRYGMPVFVNSPYGRGIAAWVAKCRAEAKRGAEIIGLWPARPDTRWFPWDADAICFWRGRLKFETDDGPADPAPFPSALPYWGKRIAQFRNAFADAGHIVIP